MIDPLTSVARHGQINNLCSLRFLLFPPLSICFTPFNETTLIYAYAQYVTNIFLGCAEIQFQRVTLLFNYS